MDVVQRGIDTRNMDSPHSQVNRAGCRGQHYLLLLEDDAARDWIAPIPKPPIAPASKPNNTNTGMLSISFLLLAFAMRFSPLLF
jgi:hypothetical protein